MNIKSIFLILVLFYCNLFAQEDITINVSSYVRKTKSNPDGIFKGWGVNVAGIGSNSGSGSVSKFYYNNIPKNKRDEWAKIFWLDCDMRNYRINAGSGMGIKKIFTAGSIDSMYGLYMKDIHENQKNKVLVVFDPHAGWEYYDSLQSWSPWFTDSLMRDYISKNADVMKDLKDVYGYNFDYVEITNEPQVFIDTTIPKTPPYYSWYNDDNRKKAVGMVKMWREELDKRGFHNVKIIGPSKAGVAIGFDTLIVNDFKNDSIGLKNLAGFSYHSYTSPLVKVVSDAVANLDVELWQTESGQAPEQRGVANAISDVNLGTVFWQHFQAYSWQGNNDTTEVSGVRFASIRYPNTDSAQIFYFLRFYYFRELMKSIRYGSKIHRTTAYQSSWSGLSQTIRDRYTNMEPILIEQPPVNATGFETPDGRWGFVIFNPDSIPNAYNPYVPYKNTPFNVTINVPELDTFGVQQFTVRKITKYKQELNLPNITMTNGQMVVQNVNDGDLISLKSINILNSNFNIPPIDSTKFDIDAKNFSLPFKITKTSTIRVTLTNMSGGIIKIMKSDLFYKGSYTLKWNGPYNTKGYYVVESIDEYGNKKLIKLISAYVRK